jgi:hypothetical protein
MRHGRTLTATLLAALAACAGPPPTPVDTSSVEILGGELEARATADGLELTNHDDAPVYYRARDPLTLALSDRIPCLEPLDCPTVPAGGRVTVPFEEAVVGYRPDTELVLVHWWHFVQRGDGSAVADEVRTIEVAFGMSP